MDLVAGVDHVSTVLAGGPARQLFLALSRLGLHVAWPYRSYGELACGGVRLGNLDLEVIGVGGRAAPGTAEAAMPGAAPPAGRGGSGNGGGNGGEHPSGWPGQIVTLASASLEGLPAELDQRGIPHGVPKPFPPQPGGEPLYTTLDLPELSGGKLAVQFSAHPGGPRTQTVRSGDLAGVQQVDRLVLGASDVAATRKRWAVLLAPSGGGPAATWQPGYGPAVQVRQAAEDAVLELALRVRALPVARAAFTAAGLNVTGDTFTIGTLPARLVAG